nr:MAG TPA: hypothetical protein [Bacteriophage sp.]
MSASSYHLLPAAILSRRGEEGKVNARKEGEYG